MREIERARERERVKNNNPQGRVYSISLLHVCQTDEPVSIRRPACCAARTE